MKKRTIRIRMICGICAAFCWWGLLYPELTMTPDTYHVIWSEDALASGVPLAEWDEESDIYRILLETDTDNIRYKSKLLEYLKSAHIID